MSVSISDLLGKKHSIDRAELTFRSMKAAADEGNLRLAVSRGITVVIQATAAAYRAPAPIVHKAEILIQATREIIHGAVIRRAALEGLGGRLPRPPRWKERKTPKHIRELRAQKEVEEARKKAGIVLTEEQKNRTMVEEFLRSKAGWSEYIDVTESIPAVVSIENLISRAQEIVKETIDDPLIPDWLKFGRLVGATSIIKSAELIASKADGESIRKVWRVPIEKMIDQLRPKITFPKAKEAEEGLIIPTAFPERTKNILVSVFGLSEEAQRNVEVFPEGLKVYGTAAAREVLTALNAINTRFPWIKQTLMGLSWTA